MPGARNDLEFATGVVGSTDHTQGWESERDGVAGDQGWPLYLKRFADLFAHTT